jgi:hypothetical protein
MGRVPVADSGCFACAVNAGLEAAPGGTIYQNDHWLADHGVTRLVRGYPLAVSRSSGPSHRHNAALATFCPWSHTARTECV